MSSFGRKLRQIREERGRSLSEIADATKIRRTYLEALETDDFDAFPGKAYGKFFLRAYADAVGFDPEPLMADYDRAVLGGAAEEPPEPESTVTGSSDSHAWKERLAETRRQAGESRESRGVSRADPELDPSEDPLSPEFSAPETVAPVELSIAARTVTPMDSPEVAPTEPPLEAADPIPAPTPTPTPTPAPAPAPDDSAHEIQDESPESSPTPAPPVESQPGGVPRQRWMIAGVGIVAVALIGFALMKSKWGEEPPPADGSPTVAGMNTEISVEDRSSDSSSSPQAQPPADPPKAADPKPEREPEPEPEREPEPAPSTDSILSVTEHGVGTAIEDRRLVGGGDRFEEGSGVVFFTRVLGGVPGTKIRHVWRREGSAVQAIELNVGATHWRTHSRKTLWGTGDWSVEAQDADGRVLARAEFRCVAQGGLSDS